MSNKIAQYIRDKNYNLRDDREVVKAYAEVKTILEATQTDFSVATGISARTLRSWIQKNKEHYNICLEEFEKAAKHKSNDSLTEDQLNAFVDNIIKLGTNPNSAKDLQVFAEFFAITPDQVKRIMQIKGYSFKGWLREADLDFLDKEEMFKNLLTVETLKTDKPVTDINNPVDQLRLMYFGSLFLSLYTQTPQDELTDNLANMMKVTQIENGCHADLNKLSRKQAEKLAGTYKAPESSEKSMEELLSEVEFVTAGIPKVTLLDKETLEQKKNEHEERLVGYLKPNEEMQKLFKTIKEEE